MKVRMGEYDPAHLTIDEAEALYAAGLELEMTPDKRIIAVMELGNLFSDFDKEDMQYDLEFKPDANRSAAGGI